MGKTLLKEKRLFFYLFGYSNFTQNILHYPSEGKVRLITADLVLVELIWVLESSYNMKPADIAPMIRSILATPGLEVTNGALMTRALDHYEGKNIDIVDGYIAALMEKLGITDVYSYDRKHLSRIDKIKRIEP